MASITLRDVSVEFPIYKEGSQSLKKLLLHAGTGGTLGRDAANRVCVRALDGISLDLRDGDRLGLIGSNGAGKTTLLRVLAGVYEPVGGDLVSEGRVSALFDVGFGFAPDATGLENIHLRGLYMGLTTRQIRRHVEEIAEFTELGDYLAMPVRTYSAGMRLRLAFAVATCTEPEILLMDEWVLAGDAHFLEKARARLSGFVRKSSILVLASHNANLMKDWCSHALWLDKGRIRGAGPFAEVIEAYRTANKPPAPPAAKPPGAEPAKPPVAAEPAKPAVSPPPR